ncbi:MAG: class I SAM-dependent methyltransferase [Nitrospira sp.]|nr:class I SAM-dependent methyltransferase [Nitrospira sp.]
MSVKVEEVRQFWNANPCNSDMSYEADRRRYFEEITAKRYNGRDWHIPTTAQFEKYAGKDVLEIGCGIGTDGFEFAKRGAHYVGIDLTENSVALARERFELFNVKGTFKVVNAEAGLPFESDSFDHIYSFGVIHHSPKTEAIVDEMYRVLRPGGTVTVMLYNRSSINYYLEIMFLRRVFRLLLYPQFMPNLLSKLTGFDEWKLKGHRDLMLKNPNPTKEQWISMNTDGPYCPLAKVYDKYEAYELFRRFRDVRQEVWEFNTEHWSLIGKIIPLMVARTIGNLWGWHRMIYAAK